MSINKKMDKTNHITEEKEKSIKKDIVILFKAALDKLRESLYIIDQKYGDKDGVVTFAELSKYGRREKLEKEQKDIIDDLHKQVQKATIDFGKDVWITNFYGTGFALETELQEKLGFQKVKKADVVVENADMLLSFQNGNDYDNIKVRNIVQRGLAQGKPIRNISKDLQVQMNKSATNAYGTARTAMTRLQNEAIEKAGEKAAAKGINVVKKWNSTLDSRTRRNHRKLDQTTQEIGKPFVVSGKKAMKPGAFGDPAEDYNCRCRLTYILKDMTEPEYRRARGTNGKNKVIPYTNYPQWYKNRVNNFK